MGKRANPALIGAFVLFAIVICAAAVVVVGSGRLFRNTRTFVIFFPGSVNGLEKGAPVKFRGVPIGTVTDIRIRMRELAATGRIPVLIEVDRERVHELGGQHDTVDDQRVSELINDLGMRAQLQQQSFITGLLYVALDPNCRAEPLSTVHDAVPYGVRLSESVLHGCPQRLRIDGRMRRRQLTLVHRPVRGAEQRELDAARAGIYDEDPHPAPGHFQSRTSGGSSPCSRVKAR